MPVADTRTVNLASLKGLIGVDHDADDARLGEVLAAAEKSAVKRTNRTESELKEMGDGVHYPEDFCEAVYCIAAFTWTGDDKWQRIADTHLKDYRRLQRRS